MHIFCYDKSFEGLLTCVFDAYSRKTFPEMLVAEEEPLPLFYDSLHTVVSDPVKADRVWNGLRKRLSLEALEEITLGWRADGYPRVDELLFRYIRKAIDAPCGKGNSNVNRTRGCTGNPNSRNGNDGRTQTSVNNHTCNENNAQTSRSIGNYNGNDCTGNENRTQTGRSSDNISSNDGGNGGTNVSGNVSTNRGSTTDITIRTGCSRPQNKRPTDSIEVNFGDPDVLELSRVYKQVSYEAQRMRMFVRFQKAADGTFFAPFEPKHDVLPLAIDHFRDRFGDQKWIIYDIQRGYGFHYDLHTVQEITFAGEEEFLKTGLLDETHLAEDEKLLQNMWKAYFKSICIKERINPRKHRQDMPVRYWKHLTEKGGGL